MAGARVTGWRETAAALRKLPAGLLPAIGDASKQALAPTLDAAREGAPVLTGRLRKSLAIKRDPKAPRTRPTWKLGIVGVARFYAHIVELGRAPNRKGKGELRGTRFLTHAYESTRQEVVAIFSRAIGPAIEKAATRLAARRARS